MFEEIEQPGIGTYLVPGSPLDFGKVDRSTMATLERRLAHRLQLGRDAGNERRLAGGRGRRRGRRLLALEAEHGDLGLVHLVERRGPASATEDEGGQQREACERAEREVAPLR